MITFKLSLNNCKTNLKGFRFYYQSTTFSSGLPLIYNKNSVHISSKLHKKNIFIKVCIYTSEINNI